MTSIQAGSVDVDLEVDEIIRAITQAARAEPDNRVRAIDRQIVALDQRLARIEGALAVAHRSGRRRVWYHPKGHWLVERLEAVHVRALALRAELQAQRDHWRKRGAA